MIEDSSEAFVKRWQAHAASAVLFARPEGSPLLEAEVGPVVLQLLERTNPYLSHPGDARMLVNPTARILPAEPNATPGLHVPKRGALHGVGTITEVRDEVVAIDAGVPVVVACDPQHDLPRELLKVGSVVRFEADAPIHAFVLPSEPRRHLDVGDIDEAH